MQDFDTKNMFEEEKKFVQKKLYILKDVRINRNLSTSIKQCTILYPYGTYERNELYLIDMKSFCETNNLGN